MRALITIKKRGKSLQGIFTREFVEKNNIKPGEKIFIEFIKKATE